MRQRGMPRAAQDGVLAQRCGDGRVQRLARDHHADEQGQRRRAAQADAGIRLRQPVQARTPGKIVAGERRQPGVIPQAIHQRARRGGAAAAGQQIHRVVRLLAEHRQDRAGRAQRAKNVGAADAFEAVNQSHNRNAMAENLGHVADALDAQTSQLRFVHDHRARLGQARPHCGRQVVQGAERLVAEVRADDAAHFGAAGRLVPVTEAKQVYLGALDFRLAGQARRPGFRDRMAQFQAQHVARRHPHIGGAAVDRHRQDGQGAEQQGPLQNVELRTERDRQDSRQIPAAFTADEEQGIRNVHGFP